MTDPCHPPGAGLAWLRLSLDGWDGALPAALWTQADGLDARRVLLRRLAAGILGRPIGQVVIAHRPGEPPRLVAPVAMGLSLTSASRAGVAVVAAGQGAVGIDVERVDPDAETPWGVLHRHEIRDLRGRGGLDRAVAFAAIWAVKEAYLKALGVGLARDPRTVRVKLHGRARATIEDTAGSAALADLAWRRSPHGVFAVALVDLYGAHRVGTTDAQPGRTCLSRGRE